MDIKKGGRINPTIFSTRQVGNILACDASSNQKKSNLSLNIKIG